MPNTLRKCGLISGSVLKCEDFLQHYSLSITLIHVYVPFAHCVFTYSVCVTSTASPLCSEKLEGEAATAEFLVEGGNLSKSDALQSSSTAADAATSSHSSSPASSATVSKSSVTAVLSPFTSPTKQQQQVSPAAASPGAKSVTSPKPVAVVVPSSQEQQSRGRKRAFDAGADSAGDADGTGEQSAPAAPASKAARTSACVEKPTTEDSDEELQMLD